jgi:hypothetical protein
MKMLVRTGNLNIQKRIFDSKILQTKYKHFNHIFGIYQNTNKIQTFLPKNVQTFLIKYKHFWIFTKIQMRTKTM